MDLVEILRALFGLGIVLGLIVLSGVLLRRVQSGAFAGKADARLAVTTRLVLDPRRQVVILRDGVKEHLILLGAGGETLIESREARLEAAAPELRILEPRGGR